MITVNALGEACPMPVVKAKKAIDALTVPETVQVLVDNDAAVQNLIRVAGQYGFAVRAEKQGEAQFAVTIDIRQAELDVSFWSFNIFGDNAYDFVQLFGVFIVNSCIIVVIAGFFVCS